MAHEITPATIIICDVPTGGYLDLISKDGEFVHQFLVQPGRHRANYWLSVLQPGETLQVSDGCVAFHPRAAVSVTVHPLNLASDANPEFKVTSADRLAREMRAELAELRNVRMALQKQARKTKADQIVVDEAIPKAKPKSKAKDSVMPDGEAQVDAGEE